MKEGKKYAVSTLRANCGLELANFKKRDNLRTLMGDKHSAPNGQEPEDSGRGPASQKPGTPWDLGKTTRRRRKKTKFGHLKEFLEKRQNLAFTLIALLVVGATAPVWWWRFQDTQPTDIAETEIEETQLKPETIYLPESGPITKEQLASVFANRNGGEATIRNFRSIRFEGTLNLGKQTHQVYGVKMKPDRAILKFFIGEGEMQFGVSGDTVWRQIQRPGAQEPETEILTGEQAESMRQIGRFHTPFVDLILDDKGQLLSIKRGELEGEPAIVVRFKLTDSSRTSVAYLDVDDLTVRMRVDEKENEPTRRILYSDYQKQGGLYVPYKASTYVGGELRSELILDKVAINAGVISELFEPPIQAN